MKYSQVISYISQRSRPFSYLLLLTLFGFSIWGAVILKSLSTDYSVRQFVNSENPLLIAEAKVQNDFILPEWPFIYVNITLNEIEKGNFLKPTRIESLKQSTESAALLSGVSSSVSIATVEGAVSNQDGLTVSSVINATPKSKWESRIMSDPLLSPTLISKDARSVLIAVGVEQLDTRVMNELPELLRKNFKSYFPASIVRIGGLPAIQNEMSQLLKSELRNFLILGLLACIFTLFVFFSDLPSILVPLFLVVLANIGALGWMAVAKVPFTVLSTTLPVLVSILVLSIVTHTMINFAADAAHEKKFHKESDQAAKAFIVFKSLRKLFLPNLLTAITTSLGFVALMGTGVPLIEDYAKSVAIGVMIAWFSVMLALPAILILMKTPRPRVWTASKARWSLHIERNKKIIVLSVVILSLGLMWKGRDMNWSTRLFDDLPANREARVTSEWIDQKLGAIIPLDLVIRSSKKEAWNEPESIRKLSLLLSQIRKIEGVGSAIGLADFIEGGAKAQNQSIPNTRAGIAEIVFLYSMSPGRILNQFLTSDGSQVRLAIRIQDLPAAQMKSVVDKIIEDTKEVFPKFQTSAVGMAANTHEINNELCEDLIFGFWKAILLISLILFVIFRSIRWTFVAMLPNLISPISLMGVMALTATPIKPGIALIFSIALGIAYNNTVYLLSRVSVVRSTAKNRGGHLDKMSVVKAWYQEGNPCVFSTLALIGGFAVFMVSYFELNRLFGAYMLLSIFAGMIGDLVFLPALLEWFPALLGRTKPRV